jgi:hypothetical protein
MGRFGQGLVPDACMQSGMTGDSEVLSGEIFHNLTAYLR